MRVKTIPKTEFDPIFERQWRPVILVGDAQPSFARAIPEAKRYCFIASGQDQYRASDFDIESNIVGGYDFYRPSPDDPVALNKDHYTVRFSSDPDALRIDGPHKDCEHWINEIPSRYTGAEVLGAKKNGEK